MLQSYFEDVSEMKIVLNPLYDVIKAEGRALNNWTIVLVVSLCGWSSKLTAVVEPVEGDLSIMAQFRFEAVSRKDRWLVGSRATAGIENDPSVGQLDVAGIVRLDYLPAKNSHTAVFRFLMLPLGEEVSCEKAFVWNRRVRVDSCGTFVLMIN